MLATALEQYTAANSSGLSIASGSGTNDTNSSNVIYVRAGTAVVLTPVVTQASQDFVNKMRVIGALRGGDGNDTIFASAGNDER